MPGIKVAYDMLARGADPLDAIVAGVQIVELDPNDQSVGLGGLPNEEGVVQLDASCMHGPTKRAGSVGCARGHRDAGRGRQGGDGLHRSHHARRRGREEVRARDGIQGAESPHRAEPADWLRWKAKLNPSDNWLDPIDAAASQTDAGRIGRPTRRTRLRVSRLLRLARRSVHYGTINMNAVTASGDIASVTTTSGLSWKIPGRVGDSPIIGAGQYCDNDVGAAGSTGRGEANIKVCGAFLAVEFMRQGMSPEQALMKTMERVIAMTEKRLLNDKGRPYFQLQFYAVNKKGDYAGACCVRGLGVRRRRREGRAHREVRVLFKKYEQPKGPISGDDDQAVRHSIVQQRVTTTSRTIRVVAWVVFLGSRRFRRTRTATPSARTGSRIST